MIPFSKDFLNYNFENEFLLLKGNYYRRKEKFLKLFRNYVLQKKTNTSHNLGVSLSPLLSLQTLVLVAVSFVMNLYDNFS